MNYSLNKYEDEGKTFIRYTGKVLAVESHTGSYVRGSTTNTVFSGKELNISSISSRYSMAKIVLENGRHKEFHTEGIEMQEGDEVDYLVTEAGQYIYVKNLTTDIEDVAGAIYHREDAVNFIAIALLACVAYGLYKVFDQHSVFSGLVWTITSGSVLLFASLQWQKHVNAMDLKFQTKVLLTGVTVRNFKPVHVSR